MRRYTGVLLLILALVSLAACATMQQDLVKLQADIQAKKAELVPKLQAGIVFANAQTPPDTEWASCQQVFLDIAQSPTAPAPDITNPLVNVEIAHQAALLGSGNSAQAASLLQKINTGCAAWYMRTKVEVGAIAVKILSLLPK